MVVVPYEPADTSSATDHPGGVALGRHPTVPSCQPTHASVCANDAKVHDLTLQSAQRSKKTPARGRRREDHVAVAVKDTVESCPLKLKALVIRVCSCSNDDARENLVMEEVGFAPDISGHDEVVAAVGRNRTKSDQIGGRSKSVWVIRPAAAPNALGASREGKEGRYDQDRDGRQGLGIAHSRHLCSSRPPTLGRETAACRIGLHDDASTDN